MVPSPRGRCSMYYLLRIIEDEGVFNDPDTLKPYPFMKDHIAIYNNLCPNAELFYQDYFANNEETKKKFLMLDTTKNAIDFYYKTYISPSSRMPKLPQWSNNPPLNIPQLNLPAIDDLNLIVPILNSSPKSRKNRKNRKNRKARKTRKN